MNVRFALFWDNIRSSLWFVPSVMALASIALSCLTIEIDRSIEVDWVRAVGWLWAGGVEGARAVLSTIAGSIITVAGVTFSITITALTLASSQFGPRLMRNFMRDTGNQLVLGTFISTFLYCLLVLRTVRSVEESRFVPYISVSIGMVMALVSLGVLIYFIHHMADSIQADNLASAVAKELHESIDRLFPEKVGHPTTSTEAMEAVLPDKFETAEQFIEAPQSGYVQSLDLEKLLQLATENDYLVQVSQRPGDFVAQGSTLMQIWPPHSCDEEVKNALQNLFVIGRQRTPNQDAEFSIQQLVEIAVRALSPGINDPRTAITCIDWLGDALGHLARQEMPARVRRDEAGHLRILVATPVSFEMFASATLNPLRQYGASSAGVTFHLLDTIAKVAPHVQRDADMDTLRHHVNSIATDGIAQCSSIGDQEAIESHRQQALRALKGNEHETRRKSNQ